MSGNKKIAEQPVIRDINDFDQSSGNLVERIFFNHTVLIAILCLVVTVVLGFQATKLQLEGSFEKMIPTKHPYVLNYLANKSELAGLGNSVRIAVENTEGTVFDADYLETLRKINDEVFLMPGVERPFMKSLWTPATRWVAVTEDGLDGGPVIPDDYDRSPASLEKIRSNVEHSGEVGQLVSANYKSSIVFVPLLERDTDTGKQLNYHTLSNRLEGLRDRYQSGKIRIHITGFAKVVGDLIAGLHQVLLFFAIALAFSIVVIYWNTRCVRSTLVVISCSLVGVVWLLGLLHTFGFGLDPYSILVPFLVFAIGLSHGSQMMNSITQDIVIGTHPLVAARYSFRRLFLAGLTALGTDAVGFAVLMVIDIPVIKELALTASIGVAVLVLVCLVLLPILISFTGVSPSVVERVNRAKLEEAQDTEHKRHPFWVFLDLFTQRRWAAVALVIAVIAGSGAYAVSRNLKIGDLDPGAPELLPDSRYNRDNAFMTSNYAASSDIYVAMVRTPQYQCGNYQTLIKVDALEWQLQQLPGVESTNSLAKLCKYASAGLNEGSFKWYEVPRNQSFIGGIMTRAPRELFNENADLLTVYIYLKDHKADTLSQVAHTIDAFAAENDTADVRFLQAAGNSGIESATNIVVERANLQMMMLVYAAVIIMTWITFRSWRAVICAVIPLLLTSILCEALMVWRGVGVKVATLPVIALGVGIGIDYALYVLTVMLLGLRAGLSLSDAYYKTLVFTGKIVVLTGITLGVAVATWCFSPIKFQADMGILLAFMFIWNMLGAVILLPALACFIIPERPWISIGQSAEPKVEAENVR